MSCQNSWRTFCFLKSVKSIYNNHLSQNLFNEIIFMSSWQLVFQEVKLQVRFLFQLPAVPQVSELGQFSTFEPCSTALCCWQQSMQRTHMGNAALHHYTLAYFGVKMVSYSEVYWFHVSPTHLRNCRSQGCVQTEFLCFLPDRCCARCLSYQWQRMGESLHLLSFLN